MLKRLYALLLIALLITSCTGSFGEEFHSEATGATITPPATQETSSLEGWAEFSSAALGLTFRYPTTWSVSEEGETVYIYSNLDDGNGAYYIYIEAYPNAQEKPLADVIAERWDADLAANVQLTPSTLNGKTVYETADIPSAYGALTLFVPETGRYLAVSLSPYDSEARTATEEECEQVLRRLVGSIVVAS